MITEAAALPPKAPELRRAAALRQQIVAGDVTKYNLPGSAPKPLPDNGFLLVAGQVEDDASIRLGCPGLRRNAELLAAARAAHPEAYLVYKPHPDVEAGLRPGAIPAAEADLVAAGASTPDLLRRASRVWTLTSLLGFEALLRGVPVTCLGQPFYAGWGLTEDAHPVARRQARPSLDALVWAALIAYPRYLDPKTGLPCPPEVLVSRFEEGLSPEPLWRRRLARAQGWWAGRGLAFWR
ncbi:MAG: hypothetical protein AAF908_12505 [Pseudomonadota bacterium]